MAANRDLKLYFPNLNGLRFIAAFFVIINHTEQLKVFYHLGDGILSDFTRNIGKLGVMLFFVLSGFLITYLLITEERLTGAIHTKKFYIRRFLRILPVYVLLIVVVFFMLHNFSFWDIPRMKNPLDNNFISILFLHIFLIPNVATAVYGFIPYIAQAWSIGTEEQSYLMWPVLLKKFKKHRLALMISIVVFHFMVRVLFSHKLFIAIPFRDVIYKFWMHFNIDSIAIGSVFAILLCNKNRGLKYLLNTNLFYFVVFFTGTLLILGVRIPYFQYQFYSFLFGLIIINLAVNKELKNVLEYKVLNYLGKISYGIYMYHFIVLIPVLMFVSNINLENNILIYSLVLSTTIAISSLSYHYFESFFLKRKIKYSYIKSGEL
ncbi:MULTISPECIES: acyltransferase family protein [unclassified Polaribacter]|uniref:acyltransferase family protein n=1 Tax=unclassified Polaribacter TaxID=196858 RepID=UPI0011BFB9B6|nr:MULTISPECIES: acyltransferase [unclassified Polaribacter]TXD51341.1 acyltransferase [Polaribacter sp. IC063]TXD61976.1 acyltransferase [Polaribacter sp. IC066]